MENSIQSIYNSVLNGNMAETKENVQRALESQISAEEILTKGLIAAMQEVGQLFEDGEYFIPEMLISARAMKSGMTLLRPLLVAEDVKPKGKVVIGTVKGDLHDIGKNLVSMMLEGSGFEIVDLGTDVSPEQFLDAINLHNPDIVGMSTLLTTTMINIEKTIEFLTLQNVRNKIKIIIGGAPVSQKYADTVGADGFASDASQVSLVATQLMGL